MFDDYRDSMHTTEKAAHTALLNRFAALEDQLAKARTQSESNADKLRAILAELESQKTEFRQTRLSRFLAWAGLI